MNLDFWSSDREINWQSSLLETKDKKEMLAHSCTFEELWSCKWYTWVFEVIWCCSGQWPSTSLRDPERASSPLAGVTKLSPLTLGLQEMVLLNDLPHFIWRLQDCRAWAAWQAMASLLCAWPCGIYTGLSCPWPRSQVSLPNSMTGLQNSARAVFSFGCWGWLWEKDKGTTQQEKKKTKLKTSISALL